ncbi:hypothetical protein HanIR_Chr14g0687691 [Helianthus annuus]|nr:hypothetical protein HanIR_Chr14g0687691 [Helianthus annuus]
MMIVAALKEKEKSHLFVQQESKEEDINKDSYLFVCDKDELKFKIAKAVS